MLESRLENPAALEAHLFLPFFLLAGIVFANSPTLTYSTYVASGVAPVAIDTDAAGNVYLAGNVAKVANPALTSFVVQKLDPTGKVVYSKVIGGSASDTAANLRVDASGNAFIVGNTQSGDFPVTATAPLASPAARPNADGTYNRRSFVVELDPAGSVLVSNILGGSASSFANGIGSTADGKILVSGQIDRSSSASAFPSTPGAYGVPDLNGRAYLMELDVNGIALEFSATGIGGSQIAVDASGNIYLAGGTPGQDYPTTPGAYQTSFGIPIIPIPCLGLCAGFASIGTNQYVTKVDPQASRLIYSTGISFSGPVDSQVVNAGLAVDADGNAYVTGTAWGGYPFTVPAPQSISGVFTTFLTKLDPTGSTLIYSLPFGGAGVRIAPDGSLYVGGAYNLFNTGGGLTGGVISPDSFQIQSAPPGLPDVQCRPNSATIASEAYISHIDPATGNVLATQLIDAANLQATGIAVDGSRVWLTGTTLFPSIPVTPGSLDRTLNASYPGAYIGLVDFAAPDSPAPRVDCVLDAATGSPIGALAPNQILALMGAGLANASISFDGAPAQILYASPAQVNFVVPKSVSGSAATLEVSANGVGATPRELAVAAVAPGLFANLQTIEGNCLSCFPLVASNNDGTFNSRSNPAHWGEVVSVYLNGAPVATNSLTSNLTITAVSAETAFVVKVDVQLPPQRSPGQGLVSVDVEIQVQNGSSLATAGPLSPGDLIGNFGPIGDVSGYGAGTLLAGSPLYTYVWVSP
jgi:uncharacterized protein (TIGR03437 family)